MRILLIFLQTVTFLVLVAVALTGLYLLAHMDRSHEPGALEQILIQMFGFWPFAILFFIAVAVFNIWFVLGPILKIEEPVRRTLQHLSMINIELFLLFALTGIAAFLMTVRLL